ncbi:hypothetical protein AN216_05330 [Streptomyces oceani]|uniref:Ester cyclase n=2 Tax=Streptomyces oceani TaxID=1075402 RepID=A0A1E7KLV3_9ACTN|nr:hypothetical protein AN216_05330 [Streptomyces oceani]
MDDPETVRTLYRRWLLELWRGDFSVAEEILAPEFLGHWPQFDVVGPQAAAEQIRQSHAYFSDIDTTLDVGPIVDGGMVAAHWTFHGSYQGGVPGATVPTGSRISFAGQDIFRAVDGMFTEYWVVSDALGMMTELGVLGNG